MKRLKRKCHGMSKTKIYKTFVNIRNRCYNKKGKYYKDYGGRGIKVCDHWLESFENFYEDMGDRPEKMSIDRIDNNGDYTPENCRWATHKEQMNNTRNNKIIEYNNIRKSISEWADLCGIPRSILYGRIFQMKWSFLKSTTFTIQR